MATELKGTKHDQGKPPIELISPWFLEGVARVLGFGAKKYSAHNWRGGLEYSRVLGAIGRHFLEILKGNDVDPETGELHIDHLGCEAMFLSEQMHRGTGLDDRYKPSKD